MTRKPSISDPAFDAHVQNYDAALARGIFVPDEDKELFAKGRVRWLAGRLSELDQSPQRMLDFGCGTSTGNHILAGQYPEATVLGIDISGASLKTGRALHGMERGQFRLTQEYQPACEMDLAVCIGVFHHLPPAERAGAVTLVHGVAPARPPLCFLGKQSLESRHALCNEPDSVRPGRHYAHAAGGQTAFTRRRLRGVAHGFSVCLSEISGLAAQAGAGPCRTAIGGKVPDPRSPRLKSREIMNTIAATSVVAMPTCRRWRETNA